VVKPVSFTIYKSINKIQHKENKGQKSDGYLDAEKAFDKIQHPIMIKALKKLELEVMYLNIIKAIYEKPRTNIAIKAEKVVQFSLK
jgi:hypothetical protein